jgi:hypothetical protein
MDKSITGVGELSRKLLTILVLSAMTTLGNAADNSIYIDQAGDDSNITMTQDGSGNRVRGIAANGTAGQDTDSAVINGDNMTVNINQVGSGNELSLGVNTVSTIGAPTTINYDVSGGSNTAIINLNNAGVSGANTASTIDITQTGGGNYTDIDVLGSTNSLIAVQSGGSAVLKSTVDADGTTQTIDTSGGTANSVSTSLTGDNGTVDITAVGASNTFDITQSGGGVSGHNATLDVTGSSNSYTLVQSGTIDTAVGIATVGSGNTFTITTGN